ncbi:MAG: PmoA family protein [Verrucomicrobia bacterium]|nr:PmoA family protein [Verrucomicrobiota bacterium]
MKLVSVWSFIAMLVWPAARADAADTFRFTEAGEYSLALFEGGRPVLAYNHGVIQPPAGVPADRARSSYVHPLYGIDGEVLTDDFPKDHHHHRGLFWSWPHVRIGDQHYDLWALKGIEHRFVRWLARDAGASGATLGVENGWFVGSRKVMQEQVWLRVAPSSKDGRALDVELIWKPISDPITLEGAEGKSYGGLTLRFAPRMETVITTPLGQGDKDLTVTHLPWADFSARFAGREQASGAAIFVAPDHPDYPPEWLTRHYGVLCLGWPGVKAKTFQPGESIRCRYRVWIHRGAPDVEKVKQAYRAYEQALPAKMGKE